MSILFNQLNRSMNDYIQLLIPQLLPPELPLNETGHILFDNHHL